MGCHVDRLTAGWIPQVSGMLTGRGSHSLWGNLKASEGRGTCYCQTDPLLPGVGFPDGEGPAERVLGPDGRWDLSTVGFTRSEDLGLGRNLGLIKSNPMTLQMRKLRSREGKYLLKVMKVPSSSARIQQGPLTQNPLCFLLDHTAFFWGQGVGKR